MRAVGVCTGDVGNRDKWSMEVQDRGGRPQIVGRKAKTKKNNIIFNILDLRFGIIDWWQIGWLFIEKRIIIEVHLRACIY